MGSFPGLGSAAGKMDHFGPDIVKRITRKLLILNKLGFPAVGFGLFHVKRESLSRETSEIGLCFT
jgi:hypothetical protein